MLCDQFSSRTRVCITRYGNLYTSFSFVIVVWILCQYTHRTDTLRIHVYFMLNYACVRVFFFFPVCVLLYLIFYFLFIYFTFDIQPLYFIFS